MAGARINSYGASLAAVADRFRTIVPGALYGNFFGESAAPGRNLAAGGSAPAVAGEPASGSYYAEFSGGAAYINTGLDVPDSYTHLFVASPLSDNHGFVAGNYNHGSGTQGGHWFYFNQGTAGDNVVNPSFGNIYDNAGTPTTQTLNSPAIATGSAPLAFALRYDRAARTKSINALTAGSAKQTQVQTGNEVKRTDGGKILVGSSIGLGVGVVTRIYCEWLWPFALTDAELATQYAQIKAYYAKRGIAI